MFREKVKDFKNIQLIILKCFLLKCFAHWKNAASSRSACKINYITAYNIPSLIRVDLGSHRGGSHSNHPTNQNKHLQADT